ncbi:MAG: hypothetical protein ACYS80_00595, partial [Planctomycetota bacterium]
MLFKNPLTIVLATIVLGVVGGMVCLTLAVDSPAWQGTPEQEQPEFVHSFSNMDQSTRQVYLNQITNPEDGFFDKLEALLKNTWDFTTPHKWILLLSVLL